MAAGLGPVPPGRHVAPAPVARPRLVEEQPRTGVVGADPDPLLAAAPDLADDRLGDPGEDVAAPIPPGAGTQSDPIAGGHELDSFMGRKRTVDLVDRARIGSLGVG